VLAAGAKGFVKQGEPGREPHACDPHRGTQRSLPRSTAAKLLVEHEQQPREKGKGAVNRLSMREREVLSLTAEGHTSTEIGKLLHLQPEKRRYIRARVMDKLGLKHRSELVHFALRAGLLTIE